MSVDVDELKRHLPLAKIVAKDLYGVKWHRNRAKCPRPQNHAHQDRDPSFVYLDKEDRLHCYSQQCFDDLPVDAIDFVCQMEGCAFPDALRMLSDCYAPGTAVNRKAALRRKPSTRTELEKEGWKQVGEYPMGEGVRKLRFEHPHQIQPEKNRPEKTFIWEHLADNGCWKPGRNGRPYQAYGNVPFRERDQVDTVLGVESERSADVVAQFDIPAFSFKELTAENASAFSGIGVVLLPDKDAPGIKLADRAAELLLPHARSVSMIAPPIEWPNAGDLYDAVQDGWDQVRIQALISTAQPALPNSWRPARNHTAAGLRVWTLAELRDAEFPAPVPVIEDLIDEGETVGVVGKPKAGKSRLVQQMAIALTRGQSFLGHSVPKPRRVLILDFENRPAKTRLRFRKMSEPAPGDQHLLLYAAGTLSDMKISLASQTGVATMIELVCHHKPEVLIIDNWRLVLGGDENKTEVVMRALRDLSSLREHLPNIAIIVVHHTRKSQGARQEAPLLRIDPSGWVENASGHYSFIAHVDACFGLERERDRNTGDELIVFGGVSRSSAPRTLLLDEDTLTLRFERARGDDLLEKLLTEKENVAWRAVQDMPQFTFGDVIAKANTKNRKMVASMLKKLCSMDLIEKIGDNGYRQVRQSAELAEPAELTS